MTFKLFQPFFHRFPAVCFSNVYVAVGRFIREITTSVITSKAANDYHFKTGQRRGRCGTRFSTPSLISKSTKRYSKLECNRPGRRIGQCWEATRAPTQGPRPKRGIVRCPALFFRIWTSGLAQGDKSNQEMFPLPYFSSVAGNCVLVRQLRGPHFST